MSALVIDTTGDGRMLAPFLVGWRRRLWQLARSRKSWHTCYRCRKAAEVGSHVYRPLSEGGPERVVRTDRLCVDCAGVLSAQTCGRCGHPWAQHEAHGCVAPECYRATQRLCMVPRSTASLLSVLDNTPYIDLETGEVVRLQQTREA